MALFTRDLRVHDNPVLRAACEADRTVPLFVVDESIRRSGYVSPNRAAFLAASLRALDAGLRERGGRLVVRRGEVVDEVRELAEEVGAEQVHVAADVSGYSHRRAQELAEALDADGRELVEHDAVLTVQPPGALTPTSGDHYAVFTPYFRQWARASRRNPLDPPERVRLPRLRAGSLPTQAELADGPTSPHLAPGGESEGRSRLDAWLDDIDRYADEQDALAADGTSRLSPYLHFGCVSPTEVVHRAGRAGGPGADAFVRQVAWRDFHHQVLAARPRAAHADYRTHHDRWRTDGDDLQAWKDGRTGVPIVDAGMRQLASEGWMHNRARLLTGSFLTKTLYLDWRLGARHFLDLLVDGDVANNQMNWQWVAGTGTDTRPNRVHNPVRQAHRYDPDGDYVRRHLPELADVAGGAVHEPWRLDAGTRAGLDYPDPIVDLENATQRFLAARGKA